MSRVPDNRKETGLRQPAEVKADAVAKERLEHLASEVALKTIHELEVYKIELEAHNRELRYTQQEVESARDKYFGFYDQAPIGYLTLSEKDLILEANLKAAELLGVPRNELLRQPLIRFILPDDQARYRQHKKRLWDTGAPQQCDLRLLKEDGTEFWVHLKGVAASEPDGTRVCRLILSDITERKRMEETLRESEQRFRTLTELAPIGIYRSTPDGHCTYVNDCWCEISGLSLTEALGLGWAKALHPEDRDVVFARWQEMVDSASHWGMEYRFQTPAGKVTWVYGQAAPQRDAQGKIIGYVGVNYNITERKQAEAERERLETQTRQLQKAESLGRMAGAIAHHYNNQLQAVMLNLDMAMEALPPQAEPAESLAGAMQAARKAAEVSRLMVTYLGLDQVKHELLDLSETCQNYLPLLRASLPHSVRIDTTCLIPGPVIRANANQLHQVLTNLVTNAWEAMGETRSAIHLAINTVPATAIPAAHRFPIGWQPDAPAYACLEVADTGSGIADKDIEKLFDPFFTTKFIGRGLGLPVVLGIAKTHHGAVTVTSELGQGSRFRLFLPLSTEAIVRPPAPTVPARKSLLTGTILLVEDEQTSRTVVALALKRMGFKVLAAADGVEAVELFKQHQAETDCVLCDLTMPRMNGWETLAALRQIVPIIPVILASGYDEAHVMKDEHAEKPQAFLGKPYELDALRTTLERVLGQA
ncbi:MAG: PAS domain S-box protein [Verrucomicrobiota bacterium]